MPTRRSNPKWTPRLHFSIPKFSPSPRIVCSAFLNEEPALAEYRFALSDIRREQSHLLPGSEQTLLDQFQPQIGDWQYDLYQQIVAGISFGTVQTARARSTWSASETS